MNKSTLVGALFRNASLDGILKPIYDKAQELATFAESNRNLAIAKRQEAERLQSEAHSLEVEAARAVVIQSRIAECL